MRTNFLWAFAASIFLYSVFTIPANATDTAITVLEKARAECSSFDGGVLKTDPDSTITLVDLTGDGKPEEIVDGNKFSCPTALTLFCGTGGCVVTLIVKEKPFEFLSKGWKVEAGADGLPVFKSAVHWSQCNYKSTCWETFKWDGTKFKSLGSKAESDS